MESEPAAQNHTTKFVTVGLLRWLGTAILAVLFYLLIRLHQGRTLTSGQKTIFDALVVAISLALGLNSAASLRHIAMHAKRWVESRRHVEVKEVCRFPSPLPPPRCGRATLMCGQIEVHSFVALLQLLLRTPVLLLKVACILWLLLNLVGLGTPS